MIRFRIQSCVVALALSCAGVLASWTDVWAANIFVPADHSSIQGAIDAASNGDTIFVSDGTYFEHSVTFGGTNVRVVSMNGPDVTIVDAGQLGPVFRFVNGENRQASIEGFTIRNGKANQQFEGGGIFVTGSSPSIIGNRVVNNQNSRPNGAGGGIKVSRGSNPLIQSNLIQGNLAAGNGGGIRLAGTNSQPTSGEILDNDFINNVASGTVNSNGGAISLSVADSVEIRGNLFQQNSADSVAGAISTFVVGSLDIIDNVFDSNSAADFAGAIRLEDDRLELPMTARVAGNTFDGNTTQGEGGAIHAFFEAGDAATATVGSVFNIVGNVFSNNVAEDPACTSFNDSECGDGGALQAIRQNNGYGRLVVRNNEFIGNHADLYGAAQFNKPELLFEGNLVRGNTVRFRYAGISCENIGDAPCAILRNDFQDNSSTSGNGSGRHNGGIYIKGPSLAEVVNNFFSQNSGDRAGAVYYIDDGSNGSLRLYHNSFSDNSAANAGGGSVWIDGDADVAANVFSGDIRGIRVENTSRQLSIEENNFHLNSSAAVRFGATDFDVSSLNDESFAKGNLMVASDFVDAAGGDLHLAEGSALIDSTPCISGISVDFDGDQRPYGSSCEVGADEFVLDQAIFGDRFEADTF